MVTNCNLPNFWKSGKPLTMRFSVSGNPTIELLSSHFQKRGILPKNYHGCVFICCCFFYRGDCIELTVAKYLKMAHSNKNWRVLVPVLTDWVRLAPFTPPFSPKSFDQVFEITILFSIVKKSKSYVFGDKMTPHSHRKKIFKIYDLPFVYVGYC